MLDLARWALVVVGLVYFVTESAISAPVRIALARRNALVALGLYCPGCCGFWVGLALEPLFPSNTTDWLRFVWAGAAAMGLTATWSKLTGGNAAWVAEAPMREQQLDDQATTREEAQGD